MAWLTEPLAPSRHHLTSFDSGEQVLDDWLRLHSVGAEARRVARTFVWLPESRSRVGGYYAIAGHLLGREALPGAFAHGSPAQIPAVLLAKLAVDVRDQGRGVGSALLGDALKRILAASMTIAARLVVVDAISEQAVGFYEHHGFRRIAGSARLVVKMSEVAAAGE